MGTDLKDECIRLLMGMVRGDGMELQDTQWPVDAWQVARGARDRDYFDDHELPALVVADA